MFTALPIGIDGRTLPLRNKTAFWLNSYESIKRRHCCGSCLQPKALNNLSMSIQKQWLSTCRFPYLGDSKSQPCNLGPSTGLSQIYYKESGSARDKI